MIDLALSRPAVVAFAVLGAALSSLASFLHARDRISPKVSNVLNYAGYGFMGASMLLFVLAGLRAPS